MCSKPAIRYVAQLNHVREVSLSGEADFGFWSSYLEGEELIPVKDGAGAHVKIMAATMGYLGVRFTEVGIAVRARFPAHPQSEGVYLLQAFTSSRLFAWCERVLFQAPYAFAECRMSLENSPFVTVRIRSNELLVLERKNGRAPTSAGEQCWEGPVFLPGRHSRGNGRMFFARLQGQTVVCSFESRDAFSIDPQAATGVFRLLIESNFSPKEWVIRTDAAHAKSRTYRRSRTFDQAGSAD